MAPGEIWQRSLDEGERRLRRRWVGMLATGVVGGLDVMFGILALTVTAGALHAVMPEAPAHVLASTTFGIAFAFIAIGRSELFTENFLVPVAAVWGRRGSIWDLCRLWGLTLVANLAIITVFALLLSESGVLEPEAYESAGNLSDSFLERGPGAALLSAIAAGTVMTLFTWLALGTGADTARIALGLIVGFILAAPKLNHAVVAYGEVLFGLTAGTGGGDAGQLFGNLGIAIVGNLIGGVGFVTLTRLAQVRGEPADDDGTWTPAG